MTARKTPEFDKDVRKTIESDPEYAMEYFEELSTRPLPVQLTLLRRFLGLTQEALAQALGLKQTHISRLENVDSNHLLSLYIRAAKKLGARLAIVPDGMALIPQKRLKKLSAASANLVY